MDKRAEVEAWLKDFIALPQARIDHADILGSLRYAGDDAHEVMEAFMNTFKVDMSAFDPWQHYDADEPPNWRRYRPYASDGHELPLLPITLTDLTIAAEVGRWTASYAGREVRFVRFSWLFAGKLVFWFLAIVAAIVLIDVYAF
jgi:hypothetical protein